MKMKQITIFLLIFLLVGCSAPHEFAGTELSAPHPVPDFELVSAAGPTHLNDFTGKYLFVYFGYTFCPDVCPLTLATLKSVREKLPDAADRIQVVMVTVDPERDTTEVMETYMGYFDDSFIGLSGSKADIDALGEPFGLFYEKQEGSAATGYLVNHTSRFYLIDPQGNARIAYPHGTEAEQIVADLAYLFKHES